MDNIWVMFLHLEEKSMYIYIHVCIPNIVRQYRTIQKIYESIIENN